MNEAETRAEQIDPALAAAGWGVVAGSGIRREYKIAPGRLGAVYQQKPAMEGLRKSLLHQAFSGGL